MNKPRSHRPSTPEEDEELDRFRFSLAVEFHEANPPAPEDKMRLAHPAYQARRLARYLDFLADIVDEGFDNRTDARAAQRAVAAIREIKRHRLDDLPPHEVMTQRLALFVERLPHLSDETIADLVLHQVMISDFEVARLMNHNRGAMVAAVAAWRANRGKWEALSAVLEGTGAKVEAGSIQTAWHRRNSQDKPRKLHRGKAR